MTSGPYYNAESSSFSCPVCAEDVCKNQSSAIKFIYHFKKCSGQVYSFTKSCDECEESFTEFKAYKTHILLHTSNKNFVCHLCTKSFPSNARLNYHVQYVHSSYKPYKCDKCEKSYKRKAELQEHEEMSHSSNFNYSCDKELTFAGDIIEDGIYRYTPTLKLWSFRLNEKIDKLGTSARKPTVEEWFTLFTAEQRQECINQNAEYEADRAELIERLNEWEEKKRRNLINKL